MKHYPKYIKKIIYSNDIINKKIKLAAKWIDKKFSNAKKPPILLAILKSSILFYSNLVLNIKTNIIFDFIVIKSYKGKIHPISKPKIIVDLFNKIKDRDVVIVEDIADSAKTLMSLIKYLQSQKPKSLTTMVLIDKPCKRHKYLKSFKPDYACFKLDHDYFLIGYGLDINELARNLPYIAVFDKKYINKI